MVPNGTSTSRTSVRDASESSVSNLNAAPLQSLETAIEKDLNVLYVTLKKRHPDYLLIFERDHHYVVLNEDASCLLGDIVSAGKKAALVSPLNA